MFRIGPVFFIHLDSSSVVAMVKIQKKQGRARDKVNFWAVSESRKSVTDTNHRFELNVWRFPFI